MSEPALRKELGLRDLVLFNIAAIFSTRWIAAAAHIGPGSLLLWLFAAVLFLVPCAFVVAHLSRLFPEEGGLYVWTRQAFGDWHAFLCVWFYYLNNVFWIAGVLVAFLGMIIYAFNAKAATLAEDPYFIIPCALVLLLGIVVSNYVGLRIAKWVDNLGGIGAYLIWILLVIAASVAVARGLAVTRFHLLPGWDLDKLNFWSQMAFGMTGLELCPILSGEMREPRRIITRATWISTVAVLLLYVFGTAGILVFLTPPNVSPIVGLAAAAQQASHVLAWRWLPVAIALLILLSTGGQIGTYFGACSRLPFVLGIGNLLPPAFARLHPKYGTPYLSILVLGVTTGVLLVVSQLGETFRAAYQIMVDMTVITLFIPFLYIFLAAWKFGKKLAAASGLGVSILAIAMSFLPTADVRSVWSFETKLAGGCVLLFVLGWLCFRSYRTRPA
jgi:amino acid transporter